MCQAFDLTTVFLITTLQHIYYIFVIISTFQIRNLRFIESQLHYLPRIILGSGLPRWLSSKESACNARDTGNMGLIPGSGRSPGGGHGNPLQYSCLENPMDRVWRAIVHRVTKSWTRLKQLSTAQHSTAYQEVEVGTKYLDSKSPAVSTKRETIYLRKV